MTAQNAFPHRVYAHDNGHFPQSPALALHIWHRIRTKGVTWYAVDYDILDTDSIKLSVYEMADGFYGGIGECIKTVKVTEFTDKERKMLDDAIIRRYTYLAELELERREKEARLLKIEAIRQELYGV